MSAGYFIILTTRCGYKFLAMRIRLFISLSLSDTETHACTRAQTHRHTDITVTQIIIFRIRKIVKGICYRHLNVWIFDDYVEINTQNPFYGPVWIAVCHDRALFKLTRNLEVSGMTTFSKTRICELWNLISKQKGNLTLLLCLIQSFIRGK